MLNKTAVGMALIAVACGGGAGDSRPATPGTPELPRVVTVDAREFSFSPDALDVAAGETISFVITNRGGILHEFQLASQADVDAHKAGSTPSSDDTVSVRSGDEATLTVTLVDPALTQFVCFITGHLEAGMRGELTVP